MTPAKSTKLAELTNGLTLATAETFRDLANRLASEYGTEIAVTMTVDAGLGAAVAVLQSAAHAGTIPTCDTDAMIRKRLDYLLSLPDVFHHRRSDGSLDPVGQRAQ